MSIGSPKIVVRVPQELLDEIEDAVAGHNFRTRGEEITASQWVRICINEKLAKLKRGRGEDGSIVHTVMTDRLEQEEQ